MKRLPAIVIVLALAGCGVSDHAFRSSLAALRTPPPKAKSSSSSTPTVSCPDPTASLHPTGSLPAPGAMPAGSFMARIQHRGYLIAGVDQNTLLFAYFNPLDGRLEGFEIDLLRRLATAIFGNPNAIQFKAVTTAQRIPAVQAGTVDIVADAVTMTCARREQVDFSSVYFDAGQRLLVPLQSPVRAVGDLAGKRVCATIGSTSLANVEHLAPRAIPVPVAQRTDCLVALQQGQADAITSDDSILLGFKAQDPYTQLVGPRISDQPYGMAISKTHPEFVRFVNAVLDRLRADGSWRAIYAHWLGRFEAVPSPPRPHYAG
jgi:polar amino acid transport system substrate-binding protein